MDSKQTICYDINSQEFTQLMHTYFSRNYIQQVRDGETLPCGEIQTPQQNCSACSRDGYVNREENKVDYSCQQKTIIYALRSMPCHAEEIHRALCADDFDDPIYQTLDIFE